MMIAEIQLIFPKELNQLDFFQNLANRLYQNLVGRELRTFGKKSENHNNCRGRIQFFCMSGHDLPIFLYNNLPTEIVHPENL